MPISTVLEKNHNRKNFSCGIDELDNYLKLYANHYIKKRLAVCYVIADKGNDVIGYYTLSSNSINLSDIPEDLAKSLKYSEIPVVIIGRLAVHKDYQGNKLGQALLIDALKRIVEISALVGNHAVVVDPINDIATKFYAKLGFVPLKTSNRMFLPLKTIINLFK
ncbi:GNAT family N-acetyltransferase [Sphingobacterium sp. DK4209]|uniref:GNAT family N-acetyltransferase n=1 Tax=Sphingobacterium zhuxiongii TaxID=2662364 RepID=A0A5Q0QFT7_9SPHI|nr:GNAT family N-acetyltransferase [Sphingobacterium sp. DK4209]QGA28199.1 GNAT family N-acetyltransferase [Sphingobacterium sp. dk4302]